MDTRSISVVIFMSFASTTSVIAADATSKCPDIVWLDHFEAVGGKLVVMREPNLGTFPNGVLQSCIGGALFHLVTLPDGSVAVNGLDHNVFHKRNSLPTPQSTSRCDQILLTRVEKMRFTQPTIDGKSVCVAFDVGWSSENPHELNPWWPRHP